MNILLIEDDEVDIMNVQRAFKKGNINNSLYIANNGIEALSLLRGDNGNKGILPNDHRLILLDLNMPQMNGIEFLEVLRNDPLLKRTPVVVLTTSNADRDQIDAYNYNVAGYLIKPFSFMAFVEMMVLLNKYWSSCEML
jgi:hypothetical protein